MVVTRPAVDLSYVKEILELAHTILRRNRDHNLAQKIMILKGYLELSQLHPDRTCDDKIREALDDLTALVHLGCVSA